MCQGVGPVTKGGVRERRRSAGDEQGLAQQLNMFVRTRTDSGKQLSDAVSPTPSFGLILSVEFCMSLKIFLFFITQLGLFIKLRWPKTKLF